jgi:hypothetical protein
MKLKVKLNNITRDFKTNKPIISFEVLDNITSLEEIENASELDLEVNKHIEKRRKNANNYFWTMLQKICELQELDTIEEYKKRVKELGIFRQFKIMTEQVKTFKKVWEDKGIAWFCEIADTEYIGDTEFKIINAYYGSSSFNKKQMSRLIDNLVQDCQAVGIETKSENEIKSLIEMWR